MSGITVHTLVKNEARFVWFAVMSVIEHVDKVLLWDTGSTDETLGIIDAIRKTPACRRGRQYARRKIEFREVGEVTADSFTKVRQEMLDATDTDWFIVVDGDEIWWADTIRYLLSEIRQRGDKIESVVVPTVNLIGDIFHYQEESAGRYRFGDRVGHYNLRAVKRSIPGLHSSGVHGQWGWADGQGRMIQDRDKRKIVYINAPYLHTTHLPRAGELRKEADVPKRAKKLKYELGLKFPSDFYYPEVFFRPRPEIVPSPWQVIRPAYKFRAFLETPFKKFKRRFFKGGVGY